MWRLPRCAETLRFRLRSSYSQYGLESVRYPLNIKGPLGVLPAVPSAALLHLRFIQNLHCRRHKAVSVRRFHGFTGVVLLGGVSDLSVALVASVSSGFTSKLQAGKIIQTVAPIIGGKGGGRPDSARGGGPDPAKLDEALAHARTLIVS